ncbi:MAG: ParB/RepB/Spo0J family partition protein [Propionibacteriaceae bacterium]|jgi:ParB family chromosome partitioning protein|nr:ParB/RepB/Spo0J family partition protein [Propionibacteriaceae bacterium]
MNAAKQPTGLGRGLGELFQRTAAATSGAATPGSSATGLSSSGRTGVLPLAAGESHLAELPLTAISPNPDQPRAVFDPDDLAELAQSLQAVGLLQPVVVRPLADDRYELVMGERRWRAAQQAGWETIPAIVRRTEEADRLRDALLENIHRVQLNPLEEAAAYQQLLTDFGCTQEELAQRLKRSRSQLANTIRLLTLPPAVQRRVAAGVLSAGHARALLGLPDEAQMERLAQRVVAEGLSVRAVEELVALGSDKAKAPRRPRQPAAVNPRATELSDSLSDRFDTRVRVDIGRHKGRILIEFAGLDDLDRIIAILDDRAL